MQNELLRKLRDGEELSAREQLSLTIFLSIPSIMAQLSSVVMQYIDAAMVGRLGANDSAAIGLVASSTWLFNGLSAAISTGFTVQIAHLIGAKREKDARHVVKQGLLIGLAFALVMMSIAIAIHKGLPVWLGGAPEICEKASWYFLIYAISYPCILLNRLASGMLQCSGNTKTPGTLSMLMCLEDVVFNYLLIYIAGLGIIGAALGTALAELLTVILMLYFLLVRSDMLHLRSGEGLRFEPEHIRKAVKIGGPVGVEQMIASSAYVALTKIVAPVGTIAIASHSFAVTAESLCFMPAFGISVAATTMIGQSIGAKRKDLTKRLGWMTVGLGMSMITVCGILMYILAPQMIGFLTPDPQIRQLGTTILRIEAFCEPLYGASIVVNGVFRGAGETLVPTCLNLISMWCIRIPFAAFMAPRYGLVGVWIAMCTELCIRGSLFLFRLIRKKW